VILLLLSLLGIYIGITKIHQGNKDFGLNHEISTNTARKLIKWGIIIYFIVSFFLAFLILRYLFINALMGTIIMVPFWLSLVYLIKEITTKGIKKLLWIAFFSRAILYFFAVVSPLIFSYFFVYDSPIFLSLISIISIVPSLVFIYCYYITYNLIKSRAI
jgi:hypothetical protein